MIEIKLTMDEAVILSAFITAALGNPHISEKRKDELKKILTKIINNV